MHFNFLNTDFQWISYDAKIIAILKENLFGMTKQCYTWYSLLDKTAHKEYDKSQYTRK